MKERGQDADRIHEVTQALKPYAQWVTAKKIVRGPGKPKEAHEQLEELKIHEEEKDHKDPLREIRDKINAHLQSQCYARPEEVRHK